MAQSIDAALRYLHDNYGNDLFKMHKVVLAYIDDLSPGSSKEKRILHRAFDEQTSRLIVELLQQDSMQQRTTSNRIRRYLADEQGLSEEWINVFINLFLNIAHVEIQIEARENATSSIAKSNCFKDKKNNDSENASIDRDAILPIDGSDINKAIHIYEEALQDESTVIQAALKLYHIYMDDTVPSDPEKALYYLKIAADKKDASAQFYLGQEYHTGKNVKRDYEKAIDYYLLSIEQNCFEALTGITEILNDPSSQWYDEDKLISVLKKGLGGNSEEAYFLLGDIYRTSKTKNRDDYKAFRLLSHAAKHGLPKALISLGIMYEHGQGVEMDYLQAAHCYQEALDGGLAEAAVLLANLYDYGLGVDEDPKEALRLLKYAKSKGVDVDDDIISILEEE